MHRVCYVARAVTGRQELNTLDMQDEWELVEIFAADREPEPEMLVGSGEFEEDDDWEIVDISVPEGEPEPDL